jgi:transcriptional regulator with XRE-family HTH domain
MKLKNEIFAEVLDWLVRNKKVDDQKGLAHVTGISANTISRIMTGKVEPSDDTLRKLADKFGFNMQYLRGIDPYHMFESDLIEPILHESPGMLDSSSMVNALIAAKDDAIAALKRELATKDELVQAKDEQIDTLQNLLAEKDEHNETLKHRCAELRRTIDANNFGLEHLPFPPGVADRQESKHLKK